MTTSRLPILIVLPIRDFDPTHVAVPWSYFRSVEQPFAFATVDGERSFCDPRMLEGVLFGRLGALPPHVDLYREMEGTPEFRSPIAYATTDMNAYSGVLLPGGHAAGIRDYLECKLLREKIRESMALSLSVGAIGHGTLVLARTVLPETGRSVLFGRRVATLPRRYEAAAWLLTAWKLGDYFRPYQIWAEEEVGRAVGDGRWVRRSDLVSGRVTTGSFLARYDRPWVMRDDKLVTARWSGDARKFAETFVQAVREPSR